jgi:glutamate synthase (NADPH) small chain
MASTCPKCHQVVDDDSVCCADIEFKWRCKSCGAIATGFVIPYGRCRLCGGDNELVKDYAGPNPELVPIVQEAAQFEIDSYNFYGMAMRRTKDETLRTVLEGLHRKEEGHLIALERKYHLHFRPDSMLLPEPDEKIIFGFIFHGIDFKDTEGHIQQVYDRAIAMEQRTKNRFAMHANALPPGPHKNLYLELAAEEDDHIAILQTERSRYLNKTK